VRLLLNIDVEDLARAARFYCEAFGLRTGRRFGDDGIELLGADTPIYLLRKVEGSAGAAGDGRHYKRHWTPLHVDVVVEDLEAALGVAITAGAMQEGEVRDAAWGRIVPVADPLGHGWCLLQFQGQGYDENATQ
jgi:lactoylglutathione lyase